MLIGGLAKATGTKVNTIRFYEDIGLMPEAARTAAGQRTYTERDVERLAFIRQARKLGFSIEEARSLLELKNTPKGSCDKAGDIAKQHLLSVEDRLTRLEALRAELENVVVSCTGGEVSDCKIIETLSQSRAKSVSAKPKRRSHAFSSL